MPHEQMRLFTHQLATLLSAGVPLLQSLEAIGQGMKHPLAKVHVETIHQQIGQGLSLHQALEKLACFDHFYCQLVAAGEMAGTLDVMLHRLAQHLSQQHQRRKTVRGALVYPISVLLIALLVVTVILIWVVPVFQGIFASFGAELPWATRMVLGLSQSLVHWGLPLLLIVLVVAWLCHRLHHHHWWLQLRWCRWQLGMPLVGDLLRTANLSIWTRCMSTLVNASVPLLDCLEVTAGVCPNKWLGLATMSARQAVSQGRSLAWALQQLSHNPVFPADLFPHMLIQMVRIGEEAGALPSLLEKAALDLEQDLSHQVQAMTQLIEPLMVVVLGGLVGGLVVALYLPVFQLGQIM